MIDVNKQHIEQIGDYAIKHHSLSEQRALVDLLRTTADRVERDLKRREAAPKHGLLAYVGKTPEEIEAIKAEIEPEVNPTDPGDAA